MNIKHALTGSLIAVALTASLAQAETSTFTVEQKKEIEKVVYDYLVKTNPEVLVEASQTLQRRQQDKMQKLAKSAIAEHKEALVGGTLTVAGNPQGAVTLVEFFDYQCGHCRTMKPVINDLIKKNPDLRVVFKEFPIFGKESELASRAAIVAGMHGKYMKFQDALFKSEPHLDEKIILAVAKKVGLSMANFKSEMESKPVTDLLEENNKLAQSIQLMGTPALIIAKTKGDSNKAAFIPGAASLETLQELIDTMKK